MSETLGPGGERGNAARYFGSEVRALREALNLSQGEFADRLHYQQPQLSKVENGTTLASEAFAAALDRVAGTPGVYLRLRGRLRKRGHPAWFVPYVALEESASGITDYSCTFLMGLLQTPEYAAAVFRAAHPRETEEQIRVRVETRLLRRGVMERKEPPLLWVIVHEAVLRTQVGGAAAMVAQLAYLALQMESPHVTVQVLGFSAGASPSELPFTVLEVDNQPHAVYTETPTQGGHVDDSPSAVASASAMVDRLRMSALSERESLALIRKIMEDHKA
ncbi:helix-turn-helix domain-containing protein [Streptomyces bohaiensis]|uniref:Helix-turn-helix domain-containing protein n=1 Tax=Streptomyces bohaiensis TaxID=1431344 RepID=A0ABX1CDQ7_9ACTN|nr:helix-turn-helix transcriptional regulator [Streptomyces bohaiensis]NJQ15925.1 helix-turn-helix domain-containing protein [Streptomyces bohaiensis]